MVPILKSWEKFYLIRRFRLCEADPSPGLWPSAFSKGERFLRSSSIEGASFFVWYPAIMQPPREGALKKSKVLNNYALPYISASHKNWSGGSATQCTPTALDGVSLDAQSLTLLALQFACSPLARFAGLPPEGAASFLSPPSGEMSAKLTEGVHFQMHVFV